AAPMRRGREQRAGCCVTLKTTAARLETGQCMSNQPHSDCHKLLHVPPFAFEQVKDGVCGIEHVAAGSEDGGDTMVEQELVVLPRDHPAADDDDVLRALCLQRLN